MTEHVIPISTQPRSEPLWVTLYYVLKCEAAPDVTYKADYPEKYYMFYQAEKGVAAEEGDDQEGKGIFRGKGPTAKDLLGTDGTIRCNAASCGRFFHAECLQKSGLWPQG